MLRAGLTWREVVVLRAYCKYLRQIGTAFSQAYMEETLARTRRSPAGWSTLFEPASIPPSCDGAEPRGRR